MVYVNEGHTVLKNNLPPTRLSTSGMNHSCLYAPATERHRIFHFFRPAEGSRLSWSEWLVTNRGGLTVRRRSPIPVVTGPGVQ